MKNQSFYAFYPKDFDPRNEPNFKINSIHTMRNRLNEIQPTTPQDHPAFNVLANALYDWATEQKKHPLVNEDIIILLESNKDYYLTHEARYFYMDMVPSDKQETWYLFMIETANANGLIVYSDIDESFYFPDGTSEPSFSRQQLKDFVKQQNIPSILDISTIQNIITKETTTNPDTISPYLATYKDITKAIESILTHELKSIGIEDFSISTIDDKTYISFKWYDMDIKINIRPSIRNWEPINPGSPYILIYLELSISNIQDNPNIIDNSINARLWFKQYKYDRAVIELSLPKEQRWESQELTNALEELEKKQRLYTLTQLYNNLHNFIQFLKDEVINYNSLYEVFDNIYTGKSEILYRYYWELPTSSSHLIGEMINTAYYVKYPNLEEVIEKCLKHLAENEAKIPDNFKERLERIMPNYEFNL